MPKSLGKSIGQSTGRRLVISDIHGCYDTLNALLQSLAIQKTDQVFFLGDYINKGPRSKTTLDLILELNSLPNYFALLGNHDDLLLDYLENPTSVVHQKLLELGNNDFFGLTNSEKEFYINKLSKLSCFLDLGEFLLVHAGFNFSLTNPFGSKADMITIREFDYDANQSGNKTIVHGHYPKEKVIIEKAIANREKVIPLDNGCVYARIRENMGELLCLDLDSMKLYSQQNID